MSKEKTETWFEKTERKILEKHGPVYLKNLKYKNTHTPLEWAEYYIEYCKRKHPERVQGAESERAAIIARASSKFRKNDPS